LRKRRIFKKLKREKNLGIINLKTQSK